MIAVLFVASFMLGMFSSIPEEGMYPLSEIKNVDLASAGLKIGIKDIYNPDGISLVDALVNISGCTGSFVTDQGLIITNHHCAFRAINNASTPENNYLENGFLARTMEEEYPAQGYTVRITESYEDVSDKILGAVQGIEDPAERARIISQKMDELGSAASNEKESVTASVSEMFAGKTYVLFRYRIIRDVRLVFAPPQSIGNFGGETDNWIWPRHTGDFSFMRAYVAPDGSSAAYSKENVPFHPKKYLKINPDGVQENDFVFILGYPGRTFRHRPSEYLQYQKDYLLPFTADLYEYAIDKMTEFGKHDKAIELSLASRIKGLANTMKNYRGKLKGLNKIDIIGQKKAEEKLLQDYINSDAMLKEKYGNLFNEIAGQFDKIDRNAQADLWVRQISNFSTTVSLASFLVDYCNEMQKLDNMRQPAFQEKNINRTLARVTGARGTYYPEIEEAMLEKMLNDAKEFKAVSRVKAVDELLASNNDNKSLKQIIDGTFLNSKLTDEEYFTSLLGKKPEELAAMNIPAINFAMKLIAQRHDLDDENANIEGTLNRLYGDLLDVKMMWKKTNFIPDANSTLRLTYGHIKGYSPADAVYYSPITTLDGVFEKNSFGGEEFRVPEKLRELYEKKDFGKFLDKKLNSIPVAMLYDMDTTGGNSGSPIMNAYGELVGVNFDRAFEATINDFAWNEAYSRSIGVDIRYVLWITQKVGGANNLLKEMGVNL